MTPILRTDCADVVANTARDRQRKPSPDPTPAHVRRPWSAFPSSPSSSALQSSALKSVCNSKLSRSYGLDAHFRRQSLRPEPSPKRVQIKKLPADTPIRSISVQFESKPGI
eukprot:2881752-Rhodomonas_salina.2